MNKWLHVLNHLLEHNLSCKLYLDMKRLQAFSDSGPQHHFFLLLIPPFVFGEPSPSRDDYASFTSMIQQLNRNQREIQTIFSPKTIVPPCYLHKRDFAKTISLTRSDQPKWEEEPISASLKHDLFLVLFNFPSVFFILLNFSPALNLFYLSKLFIFLWATQ